MIALIEIYRLLQRIHEVTGGKAARENIRNALAAEAEAAVAMATLRAAEKAEALGSKNAAKAKLEKHLHEVAEGHTSYHVRGHGPTQHGASMVSSGELSANNKKGQELAAAKSKMDALRATAAAAEARAAEIRDCILSDQFEQEINEVGRKRGGHVSRLAMSLWQAMDNQ